MISQESSGPEPQAVLLLTAFTSSVPCLELLLSSLSKQCLPSICSLDFPALFELSLCLSHSLAGKEATEKKKKQETPVRLLVETAGEGSGPPTPVIPGSPWWLSC